MTSQEAYEEKRRQAIATLESLGLESITLAVAAKMLPIIPEWEEWQRKSRKKKLREQAI